MKKQKNNPEMLFFNLKFPVIGIFCIFVFISFVSFGMAFGCGSIDAQNRPFFCGINDGVLSFLIFPLTLTGAIQITNESLRVPIQLGIGIILELIFFYILSCAAYYLYRKNRA